MFESQENTMIIKMKYKLIYLFSTLMLLSLPIWADTGVSIDFPVQSKTEKQEVNTEVGIIKIQSIKALNNEIAFSLNVADYPAKLVAVLSEEEFLASTADDARSKPYMNIEYIKPFTHEGIQAIEMKLLDTRQPQTITMSRSYYKSGRLWNSLVVIPRDKFPSKEANEFLNSLTFE